MKENLRTLSKRKRKIANGNILYFYIKNDGNMKESWRKNTLKLHSFY